MTDLARELRLERAAKNQSLFRQVNEGIEQLGASGSSDAFVCECMDARCAERVSMTLEEYERIRADGNRFFVLVGHEVPDVEAVVETGDDYLVVSKLGTGGDVAHEFDPRHDHELRASSALNGNGRSRAFKRTI
jgi:hypothetical protein